MGLFSWLGLGGSDSETDSKDKKPVAKFSDACFLMDYVRILAAKNITAKPDGYDNFKVVDCNSDRGGGAHFIISRLTSRDGFQKFIDISPAALSVLQPRIRLYKLIYPPGGGEPKSVEFIFDDFYDNKKVNSIFAGNSKRIGGAGISECTWKLDGVNPAEAENVIKVGMKFEFQSPSDLLGTRYSSENGGTIVFGDPDLDEKASLIDLILHPPQKKESQGVTARVDNDLGKYVPMFYRVKLEIGWADPNLGKEGKFPGLTRQESIDLKEELKRQRTSLILNLVSHDFQIEENGKISLSVEYIGSLEETLNGNDANILNLIDKIKSSNEYETQEDEIELTQRKIDELEEQIKCIKLNNPAGSTQAEELGKTVDDLKESIKNDKEIIDSMTSGAKSEVYKQFLTELNTKVYGFDISGDKVGEWLNSVDKANRPSFDELISGEISQGAPSNADDYEAAVLTEEPESKDTWWGSTGVSKEDVSESAGAAAQKAKDTAVDADKGRIHYLYLGDILDTACTVMKSNYTAELDNMRILLGPVVINHPRGERFHINLADLPIPYEDFQNFFFERVVRRQLASYPLKQFLRDILQRLVKKVLQPSECFPKDRDQRAIKISNNIFPISEATANSLGIGGNSGTCRGRLNIDAVADDEIFPLQEEDRPMNCMLLYLNSYKASELRADDIADKSKGIYHFYIGLDKGLIKSIDFSRSDIQGLREARQAESRNLGQIRDVYNAKVTMIGNTMFYPGMKVFLNPPIGFGRPENDGTPEQGVSESFGSLANLIGIGGYYDVITVDSAISADGKYETILDCVFTQSGGLKDRIEAKCDKVLADLSANPETGGV